MMRIMNGGIERGFLEIAAEDNILEKRFDTRETRRHG